MFRYLAVAIFLVVVGALVFGPAVAQEKKGGEMEEMMAQWMKMNQPTEHHKKLDAYVGNWDFTTKSWMDPSAPPSESKGTAECKWIYGGRFLVEDVSGDMMGMPFHGMSIIGYDNMNKKYIGFWIDEMMTAFMLSEGNFDASGKVLTLEGTYDDPVTGMKGKKYKGVSRIVSPDQLVYEMYDTGPDGKLFKNLEITYMRKK
jgi:hypothetical protein